ATAIRSELALDPPVAGGRVVLPSAPGHALAVVGPDGCFERLDDAFCELLGYREADLLKAGWPSIIDRDTAETHADLARRLRAGDLPMADVETIYMHACGLLVGVAARVTRSAIPGADTGHLLLDVELSDATARS
ncbi:MAG: hypothetical protein JWO02_4306, partial [Solirubrobacterales bacterium]|nr:hypothetical protein [Solirubrobacterales bacterium]